ncbi:MAG: M15 family metallopeptidase [Bacteroidales bacterium]|nr:M15 family metallopeptidase [Bacteroidales bacterium]
MTKYIQPILMLLILASYTTLINTPQDQIKVANHSTISKNYLLGKVSPSKDSKFSKIEKPYTLKSNIYMLNEAYLAYTKMYAAAAKEGLDLKIISAFRSFNHQKSIWEAKWTGARKVLGKDLSKAYQNAEARAKVILLFSSMPGTSRHHWGTDIDIYSLEDADFLQGKGKDIYTWLVQNAHTFGYCQVYTPKPETRTSGYEEEKWHWSYLPMAKEYLLEYQKHIKHKDIKGFKGDRVAEKINVIDNYVLGINPDCK